MRWSARWQLLTLLAMIGLLAACTREGPPEGEGTTPRPSGRTRVLVAYYSSTGTTQSLAEAVADGVRSVKDAEAVLKSITEVRADDLLEADGLAVGSPVYYANMASPVKKFFEDWTVEFGFFPEQKMAFKPGAAFATGHRASGGKEMVIHSINAAFLNAGMIVVGAWETAGASATGEGKEGGRETELLPSEYRDGYDLGRRVARVAAALKGLRKPPAAR